MLDNQANSYDLDRFSFTEELLDDFCDHLQDYSRPKLFFEDLSHGCSSGIMGSVIYYSQTKDFYLRHMNDVETFIDEVERDLGNRIDFDSPRYNSATWFVYEEVGYRISNDIDLAFERQLSESLNELSLPQLEALSKEIGRGLNNEIVSDLVKETIETMKSSQKTSLDKGQATDLSKEIKVPSQTKESKKVKRGKSI